MEKKEEQVKEGSRANLGIQVSRRNPEYLEGIETQTSVRSALNSFTVFTMWTPQVGLLYCCCARP